MTEPTVLAAPSGERDRGVGSTTAPQRRRVRPVLIWAAIGVFMAGMQIYVYGAWILSDDFRSTPTGPDPVPQWEKVCAVILQTVCTLGALACAAWVIRGCLLARRFTFDAMLWLGCWSMLWLDAVPNLLRPQVYFNSYYVNRGSWVEHIPGWISPNAHNLPQPFFVEFMVFGFLMAAIWGSCSVMRKLEGRFPTMGRAGLLTACFAFNVCFDIVMELIFTRMGWLSWNGIHALRILPDSRYGYPVTESLFVGVWFTALAALRYFRDDTGRSLVERGVDRVKAGVKARTAIATFAVIGYCNIAFIGFHLLAIPLSLYQGDTPDYPSYMLNEMCGPGTPIPCEAPGEPLILRPN